VTADQNLAGPTEQAFPIVCFPPLVQSSEI